MADLSSAAAQLKINFAREMRRATAAGLQQIGTSAQELVADFRDVSIQKNLGRQQVNSVLAEQMQRAVISAYATNVLAQKAVPSYREGEGRFPGALGTAIASADFAVGTGVGIAFINTDLLDSAARHWARLNYGAGGNPGGLEAPSSEVTFGGTSFALRLGGSTRPGFNIPSAPGRFGYFNPAGQFYPGRPSKGDQDSVRITSKPTKGIGARRFLDAGLEALAVGFAPAYNDYLNTTARNVVAKQSGRRFGSK